MISVVGDMNRGTLPVAVSNRSGSGPDRGSTSPELHLDTADFNLDVSTSFGLLPLQQIYQTTLPCLFMILVALLTATNEYEHRCKTVESGKEDMAFRVRTTLS